MGVILDPFVGVSLHSFSALIEAKSYGLLYEAFYLHSAGSAAHIYKHLTPNGVTDLFCLCGYLEVKLSSQS
jgi:hypothetical protein